MLSIGEEDTALMKATESGDTDLVYLVLFHIWQKVILPLILIKFLFLLYIVFIYVDMNLVKRFKSYIGEKIY